jgi:hypothetical protein
VGEWHDLDPAGTLQGPQRERQTDTHPHADANQHRVAHEPIDHDSTDDDGTHHHSTSHDGPSHCHCASHNHCANAATDHCTSDQLGSHGYGYTA